MKVRELPRSYLQHGTRCAIKYDNQVHVSSRIVGSRMKRRNAMQWDVQLETIHIKHDNRTMGHEEKEGTKGCIWEQTSRSVWVQLNCGIH